MKTRVDRITDITQEKMMQTLDWAYETTISGLPGQKDIYSFVNDYLERDEPEVAINKLIAYQTTKAGASGFITGFGGILTMPVTIPANISTVILFQIRMISAIAVIRGYNLESDQVRTFVYATLTGTSVTQIVKKTGIVIGNKLANGLVRKIPGTVLTRINQRVGFRLVTKFGTKGAVNLWKVIPVAGAAVGMTVDVTTTRTIAALAKKTFTYNGLDAGDGVIITN